MREKVRRRERGEGGVWGGKSKEQRVLCGGGCVWLAFIIDLVALYLDAASQARGD